MNHFMKTVSLLMVMLICVLSGCKNQSGSNGTFEIGDKTFLLNGKPFIIKAAEIHYTRIPVEYWEHRIQMCKALGMNTICIYAFWNIHEQKPGEFDFSILPSGSEKRYVYHAPSRPVRLFRMGNGRPALVVIEKRRYTAAYKRPVFHRTYTYLYE